MTTVFTTPLMLWLTAGALAVALVAEQTELLLLAGLLLLVVGGAKLWSQHSLKQLRSALRVSRHKLFPDEPLTIAVDVDNAKLLPVWLQVKVPLAGAWPGKKPVGRASLLAFQRARFEWQLTATRRGVHRLGPLQLTAADPLGFYASEQEAAASELIVYPRLVPLAESALPRRDFFGQSSKRGLIEDPTLMSGARDYQHGRDARFIHWKASARQNRLIEKLCDVTEHESVVLVVAADGFDTDLEAFERCLEVVASLAEQLESSRSAFGLISNGRSINGETLLQATRSEGQLAQLLEALARLEPVATLDLRESVQHAGMLAHGTTVVCFTYAVDQRLGELMRQRRLPLIDVVCGPAVPADAMALSELRVEP